MNSNMIKMKDKKERHSKQLFFIIFLLLYALFALNRIKGLFSLKVDGSITTNEIWIIPIVYLISKMFRIEKTKLPLYKYNFYLIVCIYFFVFVVIVGAYNLVSMQQYIYSILLFLVPIILFFMPKYLNDNDIKFLIKTIVFLSLIYAIFAIVLTTNYAFFMGLIGNPTDNNLYYSQYRASMMLGSSITVSYYFNLTLPICFYLFYNSEDKRWKRISAIAIATNVLATIVLLSRAATLCMILIVLYNIFFASSHIRKKSNKILMLILLLSSLVYAFKKYDLSRLMIGFDISGTSMAARLIASNLGLYIFSKHWMFGSGIGRYFTRVYDNKYITVDGITGLIDPHNLYVLVLSETGLTGFIIVIAIIFILLKSFSKIKEKQFRNAAFITLFAFLFDAMGGSHLFNEISYSTIFWIYMGLFSAVGIRDSTSIKDKEVQLNEGNVYSLS